MLLTIDCSIHLILAGALSVAAHVDESVFGFKRVGVGSASSNFLPVSSNSIQVVRLFNVVYDHYMFGSPLKPTLMSRGGFK